MTCLQSICHLEISRRNAKWSHIINSIWTDSLINRTCPSPNVFSNCLFYDQCYPSLSATCCLSHTHTLSLSLSFSCLALFPILIVWYKNPGSHFQVIIDSNKLLEYILLFHLEVAYNNFLTNFSFTNISWLFKTSNNFFNFLRNSYDFHKKKLLNKKL